MNKNILIITAIIVAVIGLIVLGGVAYIGLKSQKGVQEEMREEELPTAVIPEPAEEPVAQPEEPITEQPTTPEPIDTSDWKTYRNKKLGFEVKCPREYWISPISYGECVVIQGDISEKGWPQIEICHPNTPPFNPPPGTDLVEWLRKNFQQYDKIPEKPNTEIDGIPAVKIYYHGRPQAYNSYEIFLIKSNKLFKISLLDIDSKESRELYDQILSTFKFLEER
jgi:hypothetical protein